MKITEDLKKVFAAIGIVVSILLVGLFTNTVAKCSADKANTEAKKISSLLINQKDSLETIYKVRQLAALDKVEKVMLHEVSKLSEENKNLEKQLKNEQKKNNDLYNRFKNDPTFENCNNLVNQQEVVIAIQSETIDSLDKEAQGWCELYENESKKGDIKDEIIQSKDTVIQYQKKEIQTYISNEEKLNNKLNNTSAFKRNWLWITNSYRNWLKNIK